MCEEVFCSSIFRYVKIKIKFLNVMEMLKTCTIFASLKETESKSIINIFIINFINLYYD